MCGICPLACVVPIVESPKENIYHLCSLFCLRYNNLPLKLNEQAEKVKDVPSGPLTIRKPPSPLLVRPPRFLSLMAYLTFSLIAIGLSNFNSTMSFTQSSGPNDPRVKSRLLQCCVCDGSFPVLLRYKQKAFHSIVMQYFSIIFQHKKKVNSRRPAIQARNRTHQHLHKFQHQR